MINTSLLQRNMASRDLLDSTVYYVVIPILFIGPFARMTAVSEIGLVSNHPFSRELTRYLKRSLIPMETRWTESLGKKD